MGRNALKAWFETSTKHRSSIRDFVNASKSSMQLMNLNFKRSIAPPRMRHEKLAPFKKRSVACQNVSSTFDNEVNDKIWNPQKEVKNTNILSVEISSEPQCNFWAIRIRARWYHTKILILNENVPAPSPSKAQRSHLDHLDRSQTHFYFVPNRLTGSSWLD